MRAGVPDEHNEAIPTHNVINTHTHTLANVAQQSHNIIPKLFRLQCCYGSKYGNSGHFGGLQSRVASKYGFSGHRSILNLVAEATVACSISILLAKATDDARGADAKGDACGMRMGLYV